MKIAVLAPFVLIFGAALVAQTTITISTPMTTPQWATLEKDLHQKNLEVAELVYSKYINPANGYLICKERWGGSDGPDDAIENFYNWSLGYMLGRLDSRRHARRCWILGTVAIYILSSFFSFTSPLPFRTIAETAVG